MGIEPLKELQCGLNNLDRISFPHNRLYYLFFFTIFMFSIFKILVHLSMHLSRIAVKWLWYLGSHSKVGQSNPRVT